MFGFDKKGGGGAAYMYMHIEMLILQSTIIAH